MNRDNFLVELGTEELPPKSLAALGQAFASELHRLLVEAGLIGADAPAAEAFWSPRRLAARVANVALQQADREEVRKGPALKAAFDASGKPTKAAEGFARANGVAVDALERLETDEGAWVVCRRQIDGRAAVDLLPGIVEAALARLPVARRMRWGAGDAEFVRPVHWLVMLLGDAVVEGKVLGLAAGRETRGHRFLAPAPLALTNALDYPDRLEAEGRVRVNAPDRRLDLAVAELVRKAASKAGGVAQLDDALVAEVAALVEWPVPVIGGYDERFLKLPPEVLVSVLETHQRYFPVRDASGVLRPHFVAVANLDSRDPAVVQRGNERVILPRLADAAFFFEQDRAQRLDARSDALSAVTFQAKAGSLADKAERVAALAGVVAAALGMDKQGGTHAVRAGALAKCDLLTLMVGEFPELQGTMGGHYAALDGEDAAVAQAIAEQYLPRHAGDVLPQSPVGRALALADRLDTLVVVFAAAGKPSGDKDPFALRRTALGLLRIVVEGGLPLNLHELLTEAAEALPSALRDKLLVEDVYAFTLERLRGYLADDGIPADTFDAVSAVQPTRPADFVARARAVEAFRELPEADALAAANKRIANILKQSDAASGAVDDALLTEAAEKALWKALAAREKKARPLLVAGRYSEALRELAALREPVDAFFDAVMVMADDTAVRANRLALLAAMLALFREVADIGRLQPKAAA
ncbi:MAG: glycine--tRNA ligase subunit beta [Gammaproteobacteria bacterium]